MNYQWTFSNLMVTAQGGLSNVIVSVDCRLGLVGDGRVAYHRQAVQFAPADPEDFVPFVSITEHQMIAFVEQTLGDELENIQAQLAEQLALPPVESRPLPWLANITAASPSFEMPQP